MLADIHLQNFRSYTDAKYTFSPNVNIIVGPNASGKTNLLEAVLMICKGKSYRAKDSELIQFKKDWSKITATLADNTQRSVKLEPHKSFNINGKEYKRLPSEKTLPVVLFEPNHLQLLSGGPDKRREYLDDIIEQVSPGYSSIRRQYQRTLAQRNNYLKQPRLDQKHMFPWDVRLSQLGGQIIVKRLDLISKFNLILEETYRDLSGDNTKTEIKYLNHWPPEIYETRMLNGLEANIETDKQRGFTSLGPHREDFEILLDKHKSQTTASRGETRTILLALKIVEISVIQDLRQQNPIVLLDDVYSELDTSRRNLLTSSLSKNQIFITSTDIDNKMINRKSLKLIQT